MKKELLVFTGIICLSAILFGRAGNADGISLNREQTNQDVIFSSEERPLKNSVAENQSKEEISRIVDADELETAFGISISLPQNRNWISDCEYYLTDENNLQITYYDSIADSNCIVLVSKNEKPVLPENEYNEDLTEFWEGKTIANQTITVKVQHEKDNGSAVLATWEYGEYQFAITGNVIENVDCIPKVALNIINHLT